MSLGSQSRGPITGTLSGHPSLARLWGPSSFPKEFWLAHTLAEAFQLFMNAFIPVLSCPGRFLFLEPLRQCGYLSAPWEGHGVTRRAREGRSFESAAHPEMSHPVWLGLPGSLAAMIQAEATANGYLESSAGAMGCDRGWARPLVQLNHGEARGRACLCLSTSEASSGSHVGGWGQQELDTHAMVAGVYAVLEATRQRDLVRSSTSVDLGKASRSWKAEDKGGIGHQGPVEKVTKEKGERRYSPSQFLLSLCAHVRAPEKDGPWGQEKTGRHLAWWLSALQCQCLGYPSSPTEVFTPVSC